MADKAEKGGKKSKSKKPKKDHDGKDAAKTVKKGAGKAAKRPDAEASPRILPPDPVGTYADGTSFDRITYLEAKLILKPDFFTSGRSFRAFGRMVQETARLTGVGFIPDARTELPPESREIVFGDTPDFRLYNNAFILRRRIAYVDGFPVGDPEIVFKFRHPDDGSRDGAGCAAEDRRQVPNQVQGRGAAAEGPRRRLAHPLLA